MNSYMNSEFTHLNSMNSYDFSYMNLGVSRFQMDSGGSKRSHKTCSSSQAARQGD